MSLHHTGTTEFLFYTGVVELAGASGPGPGGEEWFARNLRSFIMPKAPMSATEMDFAYWITRAY